MWPWGMKGKNDVQMKVFYRRTWALGWLASGIGVSCRFPIGGWFRRLYRAETCPPQETSLSLEREEINQKAQGLLTSYGNRILRLAYSYLHNMEDAEEILQDTLLQYLKAAPVFENEAHEKAWLFRVAGNLSKNRISYNNVRSTDELKETLAAEEREDLSFVWEAVKELPVAYREVIHLFYYEGCSTGQIAAILQQKESTVRSRLMRGRERLKLILKEGYDFETGV